MPKKFLVLGVFVLIILVAAGGFFWWQIDKIDRFIERKKIEKMVAPSKDYSIIENFDGRFIVNEKDELKVKIPIGWEVNIDASMKILESDRDVTLYSENFSYRPPEGCLITIQINRLQKTWIEEYGVDFVMYPFEGTEEVKEEINTYKNATPEDREKTEERWVKPEIVLVDQKESLRETVILNEDIGESITIKVPTENRLYIFRNTQLSEYCDGEFQQFLDTVSTE